MQIRTKPYGSITFFEIFCPQGLTFRKIVLLYSVRNEFPESEMTEIRIRINAPLRTRKRILSFNYIPAGT